MDATAIEDTIGERFKLQRPPTLLARTASREPIAFTRLRSAAGTGGRSLPAPSEEAFVFHVPLAAQFFSALWVAGRQRDTPVTEHGATFLFDLTSNPAVGLETPFDTVRFFMPESTMDELAYENGLKRVGGLSAPTLGSQDMVMHGLAQTLAGIIDKAASCPALLADYMALAFHAHVACTYGGATGTGRSIRSGLAPWQLRRAHEFIDANLERDPSIAELAAECGLSGSHFARAFKRSVGMPPHQWLTKRRLDRARQLLQETTLGLVDIALTCGFVDQSHFTRAFTRSQGESPGRWRRMHGHAEAADDEAGPLARKYGVARLV